MYGMASYNAIAARRLYHSRRIPKNKTFNRLGQQLTENGKVILIENLKLRGF